MRIADDGRGFDAAALPPGSPSLGLAIMRERAEAIGAVLQVESAAGAGVCLNLGWVRAPVAGSPP
jgi:two-component system nitrate/nitrite sensor histidine kinase NarX